MATPDMDVIKEIPGYKVILKAILKSQIQQLVQQLSSCTEEESVILTANVSDGTLCHLGSDSGKSFLEEKEDFKAQFLGFCLQRHNKKKQEEAREKERQEQAQLYSSQMSPRFPGPGPAYMSPSMGMSPGMSTGMHMPQRRSRPYPVGRPMRRPNPRPAVSNVMRPPTSTVQESGIKMEPEDNDTNLSGNSQPTSPGSQTGSLDNSANNSAQLSLDSDLSGLMDSAPGDSNQTATDEQTPGSSAVKVENISESEFELEITGVELGQKSSGGDSEGSGDSSRWPGGSMGGASGMPSDLQGNQAQEYTPKDTDSKPNTQSKPRFPCFVGNCQKTFSSRARCNFHIRNDHGEESLGTDCFLCNRRFSTKMALKSHKKRVHEKAWNKQCRSCDRCFYSTEEVMEHMRREHGAPKFSCQKCHEKFVIKRNYKRHEDNCMKRKPKTIFPCDLCEKVYKSSCALRMHKIAIHLYDNAYVCEKCGKSFARKFSHARHMKGVHQDG